MQGFKQIPWSAICLVCMVLPGKLCVKISGFINYCRTISVSTLMGVILVEPVLTDANDKFEYQSILQGLDYGKLRTVYPDFTQTESGLQYKIVKEGPRKITPKPGDRVVVDWEGYTIGYYGRPIQTRNKVKGGAFDSTEKDYFRWIVGSGTAVAALDEVVQQMHQGDVAQVIVPAELGYPASGDPDHNIVGPKPTTFSGQRALNFVLDNRNLIDKTLLMNIRLVRVDVDYAATTRTAGSTGAAVAAVAR